MSERKYNDAVMSRRMEWSKGVIAAANLADEYNSTSSHYYSLGDCILLKFNLINKTQIRKNKAVRSLAAERNYETDDYISLIGKQVIKISGKPFKSTFKVNTVKGIIKHPKLKVFCFIFEEDDSYVEVRRCVTLESIDKDTNTKAITIREAVKKSFREAYKNG